MAVLQAAMAVLLVVFSANRHPPPRYQVVEIPQLCEEQTILVVSFQAVADKGLVAESPGSRDRQNVISAFAVVS